MYENWSVLDWLKTVKISVPKRQSTRLDSSTWTFVRGVLFERLLHRYDFTDSGVLSQLFSDFGERKWILALTHVSWLLDNRTCDGWLIMCYCFFIYGFQLLDLQTQFVLYSLSPVVWISSSVLVLLGLLVRFLWLFVFFFAFL